MSKNVNVSLFGKPLSIGSVPTYAITDLLTITEFYRRGKLPRLDDQRMKVANDALASSDGDIRSLLDLKSAVERLRSEKESAPFDADSYYTADRVADYSEEFGIPQERHTRRCIYLLNPSHESKNRLVIDLGCGSGLSSQVLKETFGFIIGLDLSSAMLAAFNPSHGDCILASMGHKLPFRPKIFDACSSTSAVHYVLEKKQELSTLLTSLEEVVIGDAAFQLFPRGGLAALDQIRSQSTFPGFVIVGDKPHKKDPRWYVLLSRRGSVSQSPACQLFPGASCLLTVKGRRECIDQEYWDWLDREHSRFTRRQIRIGLSSDPHQPS